MTAPFGWVDPASHDFRLTARSPAINRGDPAQTLLRDREGYNRPLGGAPDAGAYEFGTGVLFAGDLGADADARRKAASTLRTFTKTDAANVLVALGNSEPDGGRRFATSWRSSFGWLGAARIETAGAVGPGDMTAGRRRYLTTLATPGPYYVRRLRDVELVVLDATRVSPPQTAWLERTLATKTTAFRVVVLHQPPYSCDDGSDAGDEGVRKEWVPLFQRHGVRLVIAGHAPGYQRFRAGRLTYVVGTVATPQETRSPRCPRPYPRRLAAKPRGAFVYLTAGAGRAQVRAVGLDGKTIDRFRIG